MEEPSIGHPLISVVIPAYNVAGYIGDAADSLQRQTLGDFEVIVVDDGSTDDTAEVVGQIAVSDARFRLIKQENSGPATARNRALDAASGEYVCFLDADDLLEPNAFERLASYAREHDLDYLDFNARTVYETPELAAVRDESFYEGRRDIAGVMAGSELFCAFQRNREYVCALWLHFFKRSLLCGRELRLRDGMYVHEDELFSPLLIAQAKRAAFLNEPLYLRRVRAGSAMTGGYGLRNVASMHDAAQGLYAWVSAHADEHDGAFRAAMAQRIAELRSLAGEYAEYVPAEELVAYSESLPPAEQLDFELFVMQELLRRREFYGSTTWRVGEAALSLPKKMCHWGQTLMTHFR